MRFADMVGKTITSIRGIYVCSNEITFTCSDNNQYMMYHEKRCCDDAFLDSIVGDRECLYGEVITNAAYFEEDGTPDDCIYYNAPRVKWVYYTLSTKRGDITLKWVGTWHGTSSCRPYVEFNA